MDSFMESERMIFVRPKPEFAEVYAENINNPEIYRWLRSDPRIYTVQEERDWINSIQEDYIFTMIDKETNEIIGNCGFNSIEGNTAEIGIWVCIPYQNKHFGREAIQRMITFGFDEMNITEITLTVFANNEKAIRCYQKIGFQENYRVTGIHDGIGNPTEDIHMSIKKIK